MKLITFTQAGSTRIGVLDQAGVVDLSRAAPDLPTDMCAFLEAGKAALKTAERAAAQTTARLALSEVTLAAPILRPPKILAVGLHYKDHIAETDRDMPQFPLIFNKQSTAVTGPTNAVHLPRVSDKLDYEGELAVVIGRRCRHVPKQRAAEVIVGYTIANDVSVRDWQRRVPTFTMGKSFDTHCPLGPCIVSADEIGDPHGLELRTWVNGESRQHSNTRELLFNCFDLVEHLSTAFTLEPGDIISTGTPGGVGAAMKPPGFYKPGMWSRSRLPKSAGLRIGSLSSRKAHREYSVNKTSAFHAGWQPLSSATSRPGRPDNHHSCHLSLGFKPLPPGERELGRSL